VGLTERAKLLGGTIEVSSSPGEGTGLEVTIPLEGKG
jgi:signal transduction histidine kinase